MRQTNQKRPNGHGARWKRLWRLMHGCRRYFLYTVLATLLAAVFSYLSPLVISFTVDSIIGTKEMNLPAWLLAVVNAQGGRAFLARNL